VSNGNQAKPNQTVEAAPVVVGDDLIRPDDLRKIAEHREMALLKEALAHDQHRQKEQQHLRESFMNQHLRADAREHFTRMVREAAERGRNEIEIIRFPSSFCTDGGRRINNFDADWPDSLTGVAREIYEAFEKQLRPKGYKMRAQVLDYPGGMPGDIGLFLRW
jgi:hypothetical protein